MAAQDRRSSASILAGFAAVGAGDERFESAQIRQDEGRSALRAGAQGIVDVVDSGEDEGGVDAGSTAAFDVGVEAVADHEGPMRAEAAGREVHHVRCGFAHDDGGGVGESGDEVDEGTVAGDFPGFCEEGEVGVARPPFGARADDFAGADDLGVVDLRVESLSDGDGFRVG
jgi:hypothetical protein